MIYRQLGNQWGEAWILLFYGRFAVWQRDYQQAYTYYEQSITLYENVGASWSSWAHAWMAYAFLQQGNILKARETFETALRQFQQGNILIGLIYTIEGFAGLNVKQGQPARAAQLFAWADARREELGNKRPPVEQADVNRDITAWLEKIGEGAYSAAYEEGRKMTTDEAIAYALEES